MTLPWDNNSWHVAAQIVERSRRMGAFMAGESRPETPLALQVAAQTQLLLQVVISGRRSHVDGSLIFPGERTDEGTLVEAVGIPWFDIVLMSSQETRARHSRYHQRDGQK